MVETADIDAVRQTAATEGWRLLVTAMAEREESERKDMYAADTSDDRRREIAHRHAGRSEVLGWFREQIERAANRRST